VWAIQGGSDVLIITRRCDSAVGEGAEYRRQGLPITTALMESTVKQLNRQMKGTQKFWDDGAELQLQLCADRLCDTRPLDNFWNQRPSTLIGFRKPRAARC
jgi:hypothetical protein